MSMTYDPAGLDKLLAAINQYCEDSISLEIYAQLATNKNLLVTAEGLRRVARHLYEISHLAMEARVPIPPAPQEEPTP